MLFFTELKVNLIRYWIPGAYRFLSAYISAVMYFLNNYTRVFNRL